MSRLIPLIAAPALLVVLEAWCQVPASKSQPAAGAIIQNRYLLYAIATDGRNLQFIDHRTGRNYALPDSPCALVKRGDRNYPATSASFKDGLLKLQFAGAHTEAVIRVEIKPTHLLYQVVSLTGPGVDEFVFADIPLTLRGLPDEPFAGSVLAMNLQTLVRDFPQPLSRLTASCFPKFGFAGAQVALMACPPADLRRIMQEVVTQAQAVPQSPLGGPWAWDAQPARGSYLFDFGNLNEETVGDWIGLVQSLGFTQIDFHGGRSFRFGDCRVNPEVFPRGREGFKAAIAKLHSAGISAGLHTYAFFIDKKADWVTPVPDPRLAKDATFTLAQDLSADSVILPVVEPTEHVSTVTGFFVRNSVTLRLENELITYSGVSKSPPFAFTGCKRGACGTRMTPHPRGARLDHLKECFGLFVPEPETTLLGEVAQRTADFYNECGFDMIYLDALDGEDILGGAEFAWHYGSQFVFELAKRLKKPPLMEMSTFHHHLWYVRSRAGAWDHPRRAENQFIDLHLAANETYRRMFLPANLGWWAVHNWTGAQEERTFPDDIEYLCGKALATDSGLSLMGIDPQNARTMSRLAGIFKRYESLRHAQVVPESVKAKLRQPGEEFHLVDLPQGAWEFRPARYSQHKVEAIDGLSNLWAVQNDFARQPLRLRIETLLAAGPYDSSTNQVLADAESLVTFTNRSSSPGVAADIGSTTELVKAGVASLRLSATNSSNSARGAWAKFERTFTTPLNLSGHEGIGLWVHGDGQGELLNIQLRCPEHLVAGIGEHYVPIDFTGWRYFELVEPESRRWAQYSWPYGDAYSIYRESVNFSQVSSVSLWLNNIPPGKPVTVHLSPVKALPLLKSVLRQPTLAVNGNTVSFPIELESGCYLEMISAVDCKVYGPKGELKAEVKPESEPPTLDNSSNQVRLEAQTDPGIRLRANVTIITEGQPVH
jgi:hypothetical protein